MVGLRTILAVALLLSANACAPLVVQQGGRTVKPGSVQAGMSMSAISLSSSEEETDSSARSTYVAMSPNGWARFGLASNADMGLQFYGGGVRVDGKLAPVQSEAFALAVCVGVGGGQQQTSDTQDSSSSSTTSRQWWGDVGVLGSVAVGPSMDLNLALRALVGESYNADEFDGEETADSSQNTGFGGAIGFQMKRGTWALTPELAVYQITSKETEAPDYSEETLVIVPSLGFSVGF